jgi:hypothetical protein
VFSKCELFLTDVRNRVKDDLSDHRTSVFPVISCPGFMIMTSLFMHLSTAFSNQKFSNCSPTMDVEFMKLMSEF